MNLTPRQQEMLDYLIAQLRDPLTQRGIVKALGACGAILKPEHTEGIFGVTLLVLGLMSIATRPASLKP